MLDGSRTHHTIFTFEVRCVGAEWVVPVRTHCRDAIVHVQKVSLLVIVHMLLDEAPQERTGTSYS